MLNSSHHHHRC